MPLPQGAQLAKRSGPYLCIADRENYQMVHLEHGQVNPMLPINQSPDGSVRVKPCIAVVENDFLLVTWTGEDAMGLFVNGDGLPVRGVLNWARMPLSISASAPFRLARSVQPTNLQCPQRLTSHTLHRSSLTVQWRCTPSKTRRLYKCFPLPLYRQHRRHLVSRPRLSVQRWLGVGTGTWYRVRRRQIECGRCG
jgi:hypothetical protein